jgi:hypothetical protein
MPGWPIEQNWASAQVAPDDGRMQYFPRRSNGNRWSEYTKPTFSFVCEVCEESFERDREQNPDGGPIRFCSPRCRTCAQIGVPRPRHEHTWRWRTRQVPFPHPAVLTTTEQDAVCECGSTRDLCLRCSATLPASPGAQICGECMQGARVSVRGFAGRSALGKTG